MTLHRVQYKKIQQWSELKIAAVSEEMAEAAEQRQQQLTKPAGSLGMLETLAIRLAAMQYSHTPHIDNPYITVFAADHGVASNGVSAFPQAVTAQMLLNFAEGGAAITVLANTLGAEFEVVNLGTIEAVEHGNVLNKSIAPGTADFSTTKAMTKEQLLQALNAGKAAVERALANQSDIFITGEMGIGNTTSAAAMMAAVMGVTGTEVAGYGTGVSEAALENKIAIINSALALHKNHLNDPFSILECLGGFEIAAMTGAYLTAASKKLPCVVDGFISGVAALLAIEINAGVKPWLFFAHCSAETHHQDLLNYMGGEPILDLGMRLGEGSGAALAVNILRSACALHNQMATFADAGVINPAG